MTATMPSPIRKLAATIHVASSVGRLGAVMAFLTLASRVWTSHDEQAVRAAYLAMDLTTSSIIVPLAFVSLLTGLVVSLSTQWGLFLHHWVSVKFLFTAIAVILLVMHTRPIRVLAVTARGPTIHPEDFGRMQIQVVGDAAAAVLALLTNVALSVYKPRGLTLYGQHKQGSVVGATGGAPRWVKIFGIIIIVAMLSFAG